MYDVGYRLGRQWGRRDALSHQLRKISQIADGRRWVAEADDPVDQLRQLIEAEDSGFLDVGEMPPVEFVAGFIDGVRSLSAEDSSR